MVGVGAFVQTARQGVVDGAGVNRQRRADAQQRENDRQPKHRHGRDPIAGETRGKGGDHVSGMAEGFVAADALRESLTSDAAQADRRNRRRKSRVANSDDRLRARHRPE